MCSQSRQSEKHFALHSLVFLARYWECHVVDCIARIEMRDDPAAGPKIVMVCQWEISVKSAFDPATDRRRLVK
jgi:hypothetical protein